MFEHGEKSNKSDLEFIFQLFQTESNPRCSYDLATVFDSNGTILHKYCGKNTKNLEVSLMASFSLLIMMFI